MLSVLEFVEERGQVSGMEEMLDGLSLTRSTLYRYVRTLVEFGLLATSPGAGYTLGPRIVELDYKIRARDPVILASHPLMTQLVQSAPGIALLCRRYRDKVLCVHQVAGAVNFVSTYERGRARPLLRGAASLVILANMPTAQISKLYHQDPAAFAEAGLGASLKAVRQVLRGIRQRGWQASESQVVAGVTGIAAPIFDSGDHVIGSLSLTVGRTGLTSAEVADIAARVVYCAQVVSGALSASDDSPWNAHHPAAEAAPLPGETAMASAPPAVPMMRGRQAGKAG
ncbi:MAG: IclR family transcriptional regulator [Caulobacteraceae bacterium]